MDERIRIQVAKEAARLLYHNLVEDYKSAKEVACKSLGIKILPNNFEVARELDKLADEIEGTSRISLLIDMRKKALQIMEKHAITQLATVDESGRLVGVIHLHDILKSKLV